jgi:RNA ligase
MTDQTTVTSNSTHQDLIFQPFQKIARYSRLITITEKIDGTNASIWIDDLGTEFRTASRTKWITPSDDNMGFSRWAHEHKEELMQLGPGHHFGEWWGAGIQRRYGQVWKRFSLFNTFRFATTRPACCDVVPVLYEGLISDEAINSALDTLKLEGSKAAPGFMNPEGIVIYHQAAKQYFKKTLVGDEKPKNSTEAG